MYSFSANHINKTSVQRISFSNENFESSVRLLENLPKVVERDEEVLQIRQQCQVQVWQSSLSNLDQNDH